MSKSNESGAERTLDDDLLSDQFTALDFDAELWDVNASTSAQRTFNPIRAIVDHMKVKPNPNYQSIKVSIGDPSVYPGFEPCKEVLDCVKVSLDSRKHNGYLLSHGCLEAREAVAQLHSTANQQLTPADVVLTNGCSGALDITLRALANPGDNILIPTPGFSIYKTILAANGIDAKEYYLLPEQSWEINLEHLESQIDAKTAAIVVNDPSNPCGSVYSKDHKLKILQIAARHRKPIIADEIYNGVVFSRNRYHSFGSVAGDEPILCCGGLGKRYLIPGWRLGWIILHDKHGIIRKKVWPRIITMTQVLLGACSIIQGAVPGIIANTPPDFFVSLNSKLERHARLCYDLLSQVVGLKPIMPQGSMYMMIGIDIDHFPGIDDDIAFTEKLVCEVSVHCLPGQCFRYPNYFRVVICAAEEKLEEACSRIKVFCEKHYSSLE